MQQYSTPGLATVDDPIKDRHDIKTTRESIKQILSSGTPNWVRWPQDYKSFVKESFQAEKEQSDDMVKSFRMEDQELLVDAKARLVNIKRARDLIKTLRDNGVRCFTVQNGHPQQVGLWCCPPDSQEMQYVCYLQVPFMPEWSVLRLDRHGLPNGEDYRGWRTMIMQLIQKGILTEKKAHRIFSTPTDGIVSRRYRRSLYFYRNRPRLTEDSFS